MDEDLPQDAPGVPQVGPGVPTPGPGAPITTLIVPTAPTTETGFSLFTPSPNVPAPKKKFVPKRALESAKEVPAKSNVPVQTRKLNLPDAALDTNPADYADSLALLKFFRSDMASNEPNSPIAARDYITKFIDPELAANSQSVDRQRVYRDELAAIVRGYYNVEDQDSIKELIMTIVEDEKMLLRAVNDGHFGNAEFAYNVAAAMSQDGKGTMYFSVAIQRVLGLGNFEKMQAYHAALSEMQKKLGQSAKQSARLLSAKQKTEARYELALAERDAMLAQAAQQIQTEQAQKALLQEQAMQAIAQRDAEASLLRQNLAVIENQANLQIAIEQQRTSLVAASGQAAAAALEADKQRLTEQAAGLEADKQRLSQQAAEAESTAAAIREQAEWVLKLKNEELQEKEAEFQRQLLEMQKEFKQAYDELKSKELELNKKLADQGLELAALSAAKAALESKKDKAKKAAAELEALKLDELFTGIMVPSIDPNTELLKQKEAEIAAKEAYLKSSLAELNAQLAENAAKMKRQQDTADLQAEWVEIARELRVKMEEEHAAEMAKVRAELEAVKAKCGSSPVAAAPAAPSANPPLPVTSVSTTPSQPVSSSTSSSQSSSMNERDKAQAKADAWWAKHPEGKERDLKLKNSKVVTTAAEYEPSKNDFPGVDLGLLKLKARSKKSK